MKDNDVVKKRIEIRNRIRREEIDSYFEQRRNELLAMRYQTSLELKLRQQLATFESRDSFLGRVQQQLAERVPNEWEDIIEEVQESIPCFNGNFDQWNHYKILEILASAIKREDYKLGNQHKIVKIFTSLLIHMKETTGPFIKHLVETDIIEKAISYLQVVELPPEQQNQFFYFLSSMCKVSFKLRNGMIQFGAGRLLQAYGTLLLERQASEQLRYNFLGFCSEFLNIFSVNSPKRYPDASFVVSIMPIVFALMKEGGSHRIIKLTLMCLLLIVKAKRELYFEKFLNQNALSFLFELTKNSLFRTMTLNILSFLACSETNEVVETMIGMGIKDLLYAANGESGVDYRFITLSLNVLVNLTLNQKEVVDLMQHPIWRIICSSLVHNQSEVRIQAYHCVNALITAVEDQPLQLDIMKDNMFIDLIITQVQDFKKWSAELTKEALALLEKYLYLITLKQSNPQLAVLESVYRLSAILQKICAQSSNEGIVDRASIVYDCYIQKFIHSDQN